jgi:phosphoglycolate phosphatase
MLPRLVLFDIDGTLIDTGGAGMRALDRVFHELHGIPQAFAGYSFSGKVDLRILKDAFETHWQRDPLPAEIDAVRTGYLQRLDEELARTPELYRIMPGVIELLEALRAHDIAIGLATGNLKEGAMRKLCVGNLQDYFPFGGFGSDHEHRGELTRIGILRARQQTGLDFASKDIFVIGDSPLDVRAARYNDATAIAVLTGWDPPEKLQEEQPDYLFDDLSDTETLLRIIAR